MSIATDIGRIATAKQEIKEVVNQDFNKITNETIDQYANKLQETYDEYESYIPWEHAEGSQIEFTKGGNGSYLEECIIEGNTEQNSYSGKNLCDYVTPMSRPSYNGITCTIEGDTVVFNGTATADNTTFAFVGSIEMKKNTTKVLAYYVSGSVTTYCALRTYDSNYAKNTPLNLLSLSRSNNKMQATSQYDYTATSVSIRFNEGSKADNLKIKIMVTDDLNTDFEPYVGGTPSPNPDYPQEIKVVENKQVVNVSGKNLFNTKVFENRIINCYVVNGNGTITQTATDTNYWQSSYLPNSIILNSGTYTISVNNRNGSTLQIYNLTTNSNIVEKKVDSYTFTLNNDNQVINAKLYGASSYPFTFTMQLEEGSTATEYESYHNQDYEIDLHGKNLIEGSNDFSGVWNNSQNWETDNNSYNNLIVKKNQGTWNGINKEIYITAGTYTFSLFAKSDSARTANIYLGGTLTTDNLVPQSKQLNLTTEWQRYDVTFTSNANGTIKPRLENPTVISNNYTYICGYQIEENSTATEYEEFYDYKLCEIGDYKDKIRKSTGKNLFDNVTTKQLILSDGTINNNNSWNLGDYIKVQSNTQYTFSRVDGTGQSLIIGEYDSSKTFVQRDVQGGTAANTPYTITTTVATNYLRLNYDNTKGNTELQLEEGSTATEYEPYGEVWYIKKEIGKVVLNGSEDWMLGGNYNNIYQFDYSNNLIKIFTQYDNLSLFANYFGTTDKWNNSWAKDNIAFHRVNYNRIRLQTSSITTVEQFKTWLSTHNTEIYYVLSTPTYKEITNSTLINQLEAIKELKTYENKTSIMAIGADTNPVLDWTLSSGPAFQKWLNNPTINEEEEI